MKVWVYLTHPLLLNTRPMDWESSALTTRPLSLDQCHGEVIEPSLECVSFVTKAFVVLKAFTTKYKNGRLKKNVRRCYHGDVKWKQCVIELFVTHLFHDGSASALSSAFVKWFCAWQLNIDIKSLLSVGCQVKITYHYVTHPFHDDSAGIRFVNKSKYEN